MPASFGRHPAPPINPGQGRGQQRDNGRQAELCRFLPGLRGVLGVAKCRIPLSYQLRQVTRCRPAALKRETDMTDEHTKIIRLEAKNVKRLKAVEITPEGNVVIIGGDNANGKTSVIDSIAVALGGRKSAIADPIRHGAKKASTRVELDNGLVVERSFTSKGTYLKVTEADGDRQYPSPQAILDRMSGTLTFDPLQFVAMKAPEQAKALRELTGLDFTKYDAARKKAYDERGAANKYAKTLQAHADSLPFFEDVPEEVSDDLYEKLNEAVTHNDAVSDQQRIVHDIERDIQHHDEEIERLLKVVDSARAERDRLAKILPASKKALEDFGGLIDVGAIQTNIQDAAVVKDKLVANAAKSEAVDAAKQAALNAKKLDARIKKMDAAKDKAIAESSLPVEGLTFDENEVFYNDVPFEQASSAEKLLVSLEITAAMNPELRVVLCRDGSRLDNAHLAMIAEFAEKRDYQVWLERVGKGAECSVVIEDGSVVEGD